MQFEVHGVELRRRIGRERRGHTDNDTVVYFVTKILMLHFREAAREQACTSQQNYGQGCLHDDQGLLRKRSAVARAAIRTAKSFSGIDVGGEPGGCDSEENAGEQ